MTKKITVPLERFTTQVHLDAEEIGKVSHPAKLGKMLIDAIEEARSHLPVTGAPARVHLRVAVEAIGFVPNLGQATVETPPLGVAAGPGSRYLTPVEVVKAAEMLVARDGEEIPAGVDYLEGTIP